MKTKTDHSKNYSNDIVNDTIRNIMQIAVDSYDNYHLGIFPVFML